MHRDSGRDSHTFRPSKVELNDGDLFTETLGEEKKRFTGLVEVLLFSMGEDAF